MDRFEAAPAWKSRCWARILSQRRLFHGGAASAKAAPAWKSRRWVRSPSQRHLFHGQGRTGLEEPVLGS